MVQVVYNKRDYKVYEGPRDGHFIKVKGKKKYINLKKIMSDMKKKITQKKKIKIKQVKYIKVKESNFSPVLLTPIKEEDAIKRYNKIYVGPRGGMWVYGWKGYKKPVIRKKNKKNNKK